VRLPCFCIAFQPQVGKKLLCRDSWRHIRVFGFLGYQLGFSGVGKFSPEARDVVFRGHERAKVHVCAA